MQTLIKILQIIIVVGMIASSDASLAPAQRQILSAAAVAAALFVCFF